MSPGSCGSLLNKAMDVSACHLKQLIDEHIFGELDKKLITRRWIDRICFEKLAEEFGLSVRQTKNKVYDIEKILIKYI